MKALKQMKIKTKKAVTTIEELESYYDNKRKIKFSRSIVIESPIDILGHMLNGYHNLATFTDRHHMPHCDKGKYRSLEDIILVNKFYFPQNTIQTILIGIAVYENECIPDMYFSYCQNIRKHNFRRSPWGHGFIKGSTYLTMRTQGFHNILFTLRQIIDKK